MSRAVPASRAPAASPGAADWLLVIFVTVLTGAFGLAAVLFLPQYAGRVPMPVSVIVMVAVLLWAPRACYRLTGSMAASLAPAGLWLAVTIWLALPGRILMIVDWRAVALFGLGALAAATAVAMTWAEHVQTRIAAERRTRAGQAAMPDQASQLAGGAARVDGEGDTGTEQRGPQG